MKENNNWYRAKVYKVVDGDTFYAIVNLGFGISVDYCFRLKNIDTPEIYRPKNEQERNHGELAKSEVKKLLLNKEISLFYYGYDGSFGRKLCDIWIDDKIGYLHEYLKKLGLNKKEEYINENN